VAAQSNGEGIGVIGFCMGGALALLLGTQRLDLVKAVVPFYGVIGWPATEPDWSRMTAAVQGHYAENDDMAGPAAVDKLEKALGSQGVTAEFFLYPGTTHAFFNDTRPEVHDPEASALAWQRALTFLHETLG
jgi:carboxymethylenebutenolidase